VFFPDSDRRFAAKLRLPAARALLRTDGFERDSWLEGLTAFSLDQKMGRYALAASWITHEEALDQFLPAGDAEAVKDALSAGETARPFWVALADLVSVPSPARARFEALFAASRGLPVDPPRQWLVATLFPFLASPGKHVLVRPKLTFEAAARLGCDVGEDAAPTWTTYAAVRAFYGQVLDLLRPSGAKAFIDVEPFLHVTATAKRRARGTS
jgi:hypothetical protein